MIPPAPPLAPPPCPPPQVWLCKGSAILAGYMRCDIAMLGSLGIDIVILTDPDREGRDIRIRLADLLPQVCGVVHVVHVVCERGRSYKVWRRVKVWGGGEGRVQTNQ